MKPHPIVILSSGVTLGGWVAHPALGSLGKKWNEFGKERGKRERRKGGKESERGGKEGKGEKIRGREWGRGMGKEK